MYFKGLFVIWLILHYLRPDLIFLYELMRTKIFWNKSDGYKQPRHRTVRIFHVQIRSKTNIKQISNFSTRESSRILFGVKDGDENRTIHQIVSPIRRSLHPVTSIHLSISEFLSWGFLLAVDWRFSYVSFNNLSVSKLSKDCNRESLVHFHSLYVGNNEESNDSARLLAKKNCVPQK